MSRRRVRLFLSLIASTLLLLLWGYLEPERQHKAPQQVLTGEADAYAKGVELNHYAKDGQLEHQIRADQIRHLTDTDHYLFERPRMTLYRDDQPPIGAEAQQGELESDNEIFWLRQQAKVYNKLDQRYRLESDYLKVIAADQRVETDAQVTIHQPGGTTEGRGMTAFFDTQKIQLHNAVRGHYEAN